MYDIILKQGKIIDGKGNPWFRGDIGIKDGFIKYIGRINNSFSKIIIDLEDKIVSPGFIDPHSHSDYNFFIDESAQSKVRQGVTTEVTGNCGLSVAPNSGDAAEVISHFKSNLNPDWTTFHEYISALQKQRKVVNLAPLVGHGTLRATVVGLEDRPATKGEIKKMNKILANSLEAGAFGLSFGLYFAPGAFATEKELLSLAEVLSSYDRVLSCHIRDEGSRSTGFVNSIKEVIKIATKTSVSFNISHIKAFGGSQRMYLN